MTSLGSDKLLVADSRFGLRLGYARLDNSSYLAIAPEIDLHFGDEVALGLGVPLNVRAYADGFYDTGKIKFRQGDYSSARDFVRILRFLTVGKKEDQFFLNVSQLFAASIGHGAIVRRYSGQHRRAARAVCYNKRVGAQLDAYGKYGGFEAFTGDPVQPQHFLAASPSSSRSAGSAARCATPWGGPRSASPPPWTWPRPIPCSAAPTVTAGGRQRRLPRSHRRHLRKRRAHRPGDAARAADRRRSRDQDPQDRKLGPEAVPRLLAAARHLQPDRRRRQVERRRRAGAEVPVHHRQGRPRLPAEAGRRTRRSAR